MIKKILPIILCLMLVLGISVSATNTQGDITAENSQTTEEMPNRQERPHGGGRGNMGMPPNMPIGEAPTEWPEGMTPPEMPDGEMSLTTEDAFQDGETTSVMSEGEMLPDVTTRENSSSAEGKTSNGVAGFVKKYFTPITSVILLILAFIFVILYKRKQY